MTWLEAIIYVLQNNRQEDGTFSPMHYSDITNAIIDRNLRDTYGITPQNTVSATLTQHPELFRRLGLGLFDLPPKGINHRIKEVPQAVPTADEERKEVQENNDPRLGKEIKEAIRSKIIKVFGMFLGSFQNRLEQIERQAARAAEPEIRPRRFSGHPGHLPALRPA